MPTCKYVLLLLLVTQPYFVQHSRCKGGGHNNGAVADAELCPREHSDAITNRDERVSSNIGEVPERRGLGDKKWKLIVDADTAGLVQGGLDVDDDLAVLLAAGSWAKGEIELLGITATHGNADSRRCYRNAKKLASFLDEEHRDRIVVKRGSEWGSIPSFITEKDDRCDSAQRDSGDQDDGSEVLTPASLFIIEQAHRYPQQVVILCVGSLSNLAHALAYDTSLETLLAGVVLMGGDEASDRVLFHIDLNFQANREATTIVLNANVPKVAATVQTCLSVTFSRSLCRQLQKNAKLVKGDSFKDHGASTESSPSSSVVDVASTSLVRSKMISFLVCTLLARANCAAHWLFPASPEYDPLPLTPTLDEDPSSPTSSASSAPLPFLSLVDENHFFPWDCVALMSLIDPSLFAPSRLLKMQLGSWGIHTQVESVPFPCSEGSEANDKQSKRMEHMNGVACSERAAPTSWQWLRSSQEECGEEGSARGVDANWGACNHLCCLGVNGHRGLVLAPGRVVDAREFEKQVVERMGQIPLREDLIEILYSDILSRRHAGGGDEGVEEKDLDGADVLSSGTGSSQAFQKMAKQLSTIFVNADAQVLEAEIEELVRALMLTSDSDGAEEEEEEEVVGDEGNRFRKKRILGWRAEGWRGISLFKWQSHLPPILYVLYYLVPPPLKVILLLLLLMLLSSLLFTFIYIVGFMTK